MAQYTAADKRLIPCFYNKSHESKDSWRFHALLGLYDRYKKGLPAYTALSSYGFIAAVFSIRGGISGLIKCERIAPQCDNKRHYAMEENMVLYWC